MRAAVFAVEQIGIDCDRTVAGIQKEQFIGQREKIFTGILEHGNSVFIGQSAMVQLIELLHGHIHTHVQLDCDLIRSWYRKIFAVRM